MIPIVRPKWKRSQLVESPSYAAVVLLASISVFSSRSEPARSTMFRLDRVTWPIRDEVVVT